MLKFKSILIPLDPRILKLYKGWMMNGEMLKDKTDLDIQYKKRIIQSYYQRSKVELISTIIFLLLFSPILIMGLIVAAIILSLPHYGDALENIINHIFSIFPAPDKFADVVRHYPKYKYAYQEDIPEFFEKCFSKNYFIFLYCLHEPSKEELEDIASLVTQGYIIDLIKLRKDDTFETITHEHKICPINSLFVVNNEKLLNWKPLADFYQASKKFTNVLFVGQSNPRSEQLVSCARMTYKELHVFFEPYYFANDHGSLSNDIVLFLGNGDNTTADTYIEQNYDSICSKYEEKGFRFVYLPFVKEHNNELLTKRTYNNLRYKYPALYRLSDDMIQKLLSFFYIDENTNELYDEIVHELGLPFVRRPGLLRNIYQASAGYPHAFSFFSLKFSSEQIIEIAINLHISRVGKKPVKQDVYFSLASKQPDPEEYDADWYFDKESKELSEEAKALIDSFKPDQYTKMADAILYMMQKIRQERPELLNRIQLLVQDSKIPSDNSELSRIFVDQNHKIYLPDYGNIEVKMHALPRTVYLLFIRHPEGIRFKELYLYRQELLDIYQKTTNRYNQQEIVRAIDDLVDMTQPSINQKCARIREAFRRIMDENIAKYYYIDGPNGEPKRIRLPAEKITYINK